MLCPLGPLLAWEEQQPKPSAKHVRGDVLAACMYNRGNPRTAHAQGADRPGKWSCTCPWEVQRSNAAKIVESPWRESIIICIDGEHLKRSCPSSFVVLHVAQAPTADTSGFFGQSSLGVGDLLITTVRINRCCLEGLVACAEHLDSLPIGCSTQASHTLRAQGCAS